MNQRSKAALTNFLLVSFFLFSFSGCDKKEDKTGYIARVNDTRLTEAELSAVIDTASVGRSGRDEYIRAWVDQELLYQKAEKTGITQEKEFSLKLTQAKRQMAVSMYLEKYFGDSFQEPSEEELTLFYTSMKDAFRLNSTGFLFNRATLSSEDGAVMFRERLFTEPWERVVKTFPKPASILASQVDVFEHDFETSDFQTRKFLENFSHGEISMIFSVRPGEYTIVQLKEKYQRNDVPPLSVISSLVKELYKDAQRKILLKKLMDELYSSGEIEIK
ncbi:MAG: hypothetical protein IT279_03450 [Ignavibacteriaceae bacterium]|nr:hypothetical protein [Ignavibacteriaceae bacterium]